MKKSSVFYVNCTLFVALVTVLLISMPVFCYGDLHSNSDSVPIVADEDDTIPVSDLGRQIDILAYKLENLENSLKGVLQSVTKTNEYIKTELVDAESEDPGIVKNVVWMIASERQEVENALKEQRELKALLKYYGSVLKEKTALLEKNAGSPATTAGAGTTEIKTEAALSKNGPAPQKAETAIVTTGNTPLLEKNADISAKPAAAITEIKTEAALSENGPAPQKAETTVVTAENTLLRRDNKEGPITITHVAIGLILIFVVVLLIVTLTIFQKISGHMNDSEELRVGTAVPLPTARDSKSGTNGNVDHSLPIVVGEAIFRIRMTMNGVDKSNEQFAAFGYQMSRVEDAIMRHGYSIVDLTGKPYENEQSMKVVNIVERDDIDPGATIINRMLKPRIMYDTIIVSHGTVELATSSKAKN
ncbi:MAG: hypothetical protein JXC33_04025 [Deltaproteobacteria bacterium]|nr:hypothetical protein [Deltaproteobacteria bacterium]